MDGFCYNVFKKKPKSNAIETFDEVEHKELGKRNNDKVQFYKLVRYVYSWSGREGRDRGMFSLGWEGYGAITPRIV